MAENVALQKLFIFIDPDANSVGALSDILRVILALHKQEQQMDDFNF